MNAASKRAIIVDRAASLAGCGATPSPCKDNSTEGNSMSTPNKRISLAAAIAAGALSLAACSSTTPHFDQAFGESVRTAKLQQVINPEAGLNSDPVKGVDGVAAREAMGRYRSTFKEPPQQQNNFVIGVGK